MHVADELYANLRGPGENMTVLATAWSDPANKGTGHEEPMLMVLSYGKGRIFHTTLGHDRAALNCVASLPLPARDGMGGNRQGDAEGSGDFPTADKISTRAEYNPPAPRQERPVSNGASFRLPAQAICASQKRPVQSYRYWR